MALWTTFLANILQVFTPDVDDAPFAASGLGTMASDDRYDTLGLHVFSFAVAPAQTVVLPLVTGFAATEWGYIWVKVPAGTVDIVIDALDADGSTPIQWTSRVFGVAKWPGVFQLATSNIVGISFVGVAAASVQVIQAVTAIPTDPRVIANLGGGVPIPPMAANTNQNLAPGLMPIGGIIAFSGSFDVTGLPGGYSELGLLPLPSWLKLCDGSQIANAASPIDGRYVPQLTNNRFLQGSVAGGTYGGNAANQANLAHTHNFAHSHVTSVAFTAGQINDPVYTVDPHTHTTSVGFSSGQINDPVYTVDPHTHTTIVGFSTGQLNDPIYSLSDHSHNMKHVHQWSFTAVTADAYSLQAVDASRTGISAADVKYIQEFSAGAGASAVAQLTNAGNFWTTGVLSPSRGADGSAANTNGPSTANATLVASGNAPNRSFTSGTQSVSTLTLAATGSITPLAFTSGSQSVSSLTLSSTGSIPSRSFTSISQSVLATDPNTTASLVDIRPLYLQVKYYMRIY